MLSGWFPTFFWLSPVFDQFFIGFSFNQITLKIIPRKWFELIFLKYKKIFQGGNFNYFKKSWKTLVWWGG